jgi:RNA polymerase sigma factor (sigma-70 family)
MCEYAELPDEDLMYRYYSCDERAFAELTARYWRRLLVFLRRFASGADAEDLTQEVFLRVARTKQVGNGRYDRARGTPFKSWVFTIARNVLGTFRRDQEREVETVAAEAGTIEQVETSASVPYEWQEHRDEYPQAVRACLESLPSLLRESILLDVQGIDLTTVANAIFGVPYGTAGSRLYNARQRMQACLFSKGYEFVQRKPPLPRGAIIVLVFQDELLIYRAPRASRTSRSKGGPTRAEAEA